MGCEDTARNGHLLSGIPISCRNGKTYDKKSWKERNLQTHFLFFQLIFVWNSSFLLHTELRWEFIKENKNSTKKAIKKTRTRPRKQPRKKEKLSFLLDHFLGRVLVFLLSCFFYKFPPQTFFILANCECWNCQSEIWKQGIIGVINNIARKAFYSLRTKK